MPNLKESPVSLKSLFALPQWAQVFIILGSTVGFGITIGTFLPSVRNDRATIRVNAEYRMAQDSLNQYLICRASFDPEELTLASRPCEWLIQRSRWYPIIVMFREVTK